jgi:murein L,D-transpeptidase YafK
MQECYVLMKTLIFKKLFPVSLFSLVFMLPVAVLAQAGSSLPIIFETPQAFFASASTGLNNASGIQTSPMRPQGFLRIPEDEQFVFWVELESGRLKILEQLENGGFIVRQIIPVSIGSNGYDKQVEGDKRTPIGIYHFTSFLNDNQLLDYYGFGAYPINYPNAVDLLNGRTGSGIWLHGLPKNVAERPLLDSDGCVVIDNDSLLQMTRYIQTGRTPIILSQSDLQWAPLNQEDDRAESLSNALESWRRDWESRDHRRYVSWYADDFNDLVRDLPQWSDYKRRVNGSKSFINLEFSDISFISDPRDPDIVIVRYYQNYQSSNYNWRGWKQQLWRQHGSEWQIIYEGNA